MLFVTKEEPVKLLLIPPFHKLAELSAHEQQFFAGMHHVISVQRAQARELLPEVAGLLVQHGALAVNHFIV